MTTAPHRRRPTAVLVVLGLVLAGLSPALTAPAAAAPAAVPAARKAARPVVTVVPGDRRLSVAWTRVSGARRYVVEWSTSKKFTKKTTRRASTTGLVRTVPKLRLRTDYWVRVRAVTRAGTVTSKAVTKRVDTRAVGRVPIVVRPAGTDKVSVTWGRLPRGTSVRLDASWHYSNLSTAGKRFTVAGIRPTETSRVVTIPSRFRTYVGSTTGNPLYVRATYRNGTKASTSRLAYSRAGAVTAGPKGATALRVATYNVGSIAATAGTSRPWEKRRAAVVAAIRRADADVVAVQEATTAREADTGERQIEGLVARLGPAYALAYDADQIGSVDGRGTKGAHLVVRTDRVTVVSSGLTSLNSLVAARYRLDKERFFAWAHIEDRTTGARAWVASLHLENDRLGSAAQRRAAALAVAATLERRRGTTREPVVLMGDLNSDVVRHPAGPTTALVRQGYVDTLSGPRATGDRWSTSNNQSATKDGGYPRAPFRYAYAPTRIDYIFVKDGRGVRQHTNQVVLRAGAFDSRYRGSDHNLQHADLVLR